MEKPASQDTEAPLLSEQGKAKDHEWYSDDTESLSGTLGRHRPTKSQLSQTWANVSRFLPAAAVALLLINTGLLVGQRRHPANGGSAVEPQLQHGSTAPNVLEDLFRTLKIPITQATFVAEDGLSYPITNQHWTKPLGKEILIMDVDTRPMDKPGELLSNETVAWDALPNWEGGRLSHYMYARIHGYDYKFVQTDELPDRHGTWVRQPMMQELLKTHRFVVSMDGDAIWNHPEIPLEWLFNHWDMTSETSFAVAQDWAQNPDSHGRQGMNGGFVVAQQNARTNEILDAWIDCPTGKQFPGCERLAYGPWHEQTAFNEYIRYTYNKTTDYIQLGCDESDGFAGAAFECRGTFVSHFWQWKDGLKQGISATVMRPLMKRVFDSLVQHKDEFVTFVASSTHTPS